MTSPQANEQAIVSDLERAFGLSAQQADAFAGNFQVESGFDPNAYNANENAHGYAQWEGPRWTALQAYAAKLGLAPTSQQAELGYLNQELSGPYASVIANLKAAGNNIATDAQIVQSQYEGSTPASLGQRQADAAAIASGQGVSSAPFANTGTAVETASWNPLPGGNWDPLNWAPNLFATGTSDAAKEAVSGVEGIIKGIAHPIFTFLLNSFLVVTGVVLVIIALVMLAKSGETEIAPGQEDEAEQEERGDEDQDEADTSGGGGGGGSDAEDAAAVAAAG